MRDERLKAYDRALDPQRALRLIRQTCSGAACNVRQVSRIDVLNHRPGKRLVVRYTVIVDEGLRGHRKHTLYGKLFHGRRGERANDRMRVLQALKAPRVRLPRLLGYSPRHRFLLLDNLPGRSMTELIWDGRAHQHVADLGRGLSALHLAGAGALARGDRAALQLPAHGAREEMEVVRRAAARLGAAPFADQLHRRHQFLCRRVCRDLVQGNGSPDARPDTIIHRDLHPGQIRLARRRIGLLDLDEVSRGEGELDAGNFVAHLILEDLQVYGVVGLAPWLTRCFLEGYGLSRPLEAGRLMFYTATALLRLASLERLSLGDRSVLTWEVQAQRMTGAAQAVLAARWPLSTQAAAPAVPWLR